jgi:hypothetical protein
MYMLNRGIRFAVLAPLLFLAGVTVLHAQESPRLTLQIWFQANRLAMLRSHPMNYLRNRA